MNYHLPASFITRPIVMEDCPSLVELYNTYSRYWTGLDMDSVSELESAYRADGFNLAEDAHLVLTNEGKMVAYAEVWAITKPYVIQYIWACVHPEFTHQGLGSYLLRWIEQRARINISRAPVDARVVIRHSLFHENQPAHHLLANNGYSPVRTFYHMAIAMPAQPEKPLLPGAITIRHIEAGEERAALAVVQESFRDHWGHVDEPLADYYKRFMNFIQSDDGYDPTLWFLAEDGGQNVGVCICRPKTIEDPHKGWVNILGVLRSHRKQGVGLALLYHAFGDFYRRGTLKVGLGVDATNLTGATRLYEKAGMHIARQFNVFEKELRSGKDYTTQNLE